MSLSTDRTVLEAGQSATLTATTNASVSPWPYYILIFDQSSGALIRSCSTGTSCSTTVQINSGPARSYIAYVGNYSTATPPPALQATSNTVTIDRAAWTVNLTTSTTTLEAGQSATLTATANQNTSFAPYYILIFDQSSGALIRSCSTGTSCSTTVQINSGPARSYIAYVGSNSSATPPPALQATSNTVTIDRAAWTVTLAPNKLASQPGETVTLTATANQNVSFTPYWIQIFNETTGARLAACSTGTTCSVSITTPSTAHSYVAYVGGSSTVAPPPTIQATSNRFSLPLAPLGLEDGDATALIPLLEDIEGLALEVDATHLQLATPAQAAAAAGAICFAAETEIVRGGQSQGSRYHSTVTDHQFRLQALCLAVEAMAVTVGAGYVASELVRTWQQGDPYPDAPDDDVPPRPADYPDGPGGSGNWPSTAVNGECDDGDVPPEDQRTHPLDLNSDGLTEAELADLRLYARLTNSWLAKNGPVMVRSTSVGIPTLRRMASTAASAARGIADDLEAPFGSEKHAGHVPDTAISVIRTRRAGGWRWSLKPTARQADRSQRESTPC